MYKYIHHVYVYVVHVCFYSNLPYNFTKLAYMDLPCVQLKGQNDPTSCTPRKKNNIMSEPY